MYRDAYAWSKMKLLFLCVSKAAARSAIFRNFQRTIEMYPEKSCAYLFAYCRQNEGKPWLINKTSAMCEKRLESARYVQASSDCL